MGYKSFLLSIFSVFLVSAATQPRQIQTFTASGKTHYCVYYVPSGITKAPVVFYIHGALGSGPNFENETMGDSTAKKEKFIAVYPSASNTSGTGTWADMSGTSDYPVYLAILDTLDKKYGIDRDRIYMTGFSQGGFVSFVAGCKYSDVFAAIAPVSGHAGSPCTLKRPVSVFLTFGAQEDKASFVTDLNIWLKLDSCPSTPTITHPFTGVTRVSYGPCAQGTSVIMDSISGEGHTWPPLNKFNQSNEVWAFFKQFSLKKGTAVQRQMIPMAREPISALYASGMVRLLGVEEKCGVKVLDTKGRLVTTETAVQRQFSFKNKPSGVYMVMVGGNDKTSMIRMVIP